MMVYLLKSMACMAIFFVFYKLLLERENMHVFKRFYLLLSIGASFLIPGLVFTEYVVVESSPIALTQPVLTDYDYIGVPTALEDDVFDVAPILWAVYLIGLVFFVFRFAKNFMQIVGRIRRNPKLKSSRFVRVLLQETFPPHTFFKYIFLNQKKLEAREIPHEVLLHEETHARQRHSIDVVFIELVQALFWFNPLLYLFKRAIKLNHEFLADQAVLNKDVDEITYQNTLLSYLSPDSAKKYQPQLANAINYSSIKKRFTIMKTHTSKKAVVLRSLLLLPLLAMLLFAFTTTELIETPLIEASKIEGNWIVAEDESQELTIYNEEGNLVFDWVGVPYSIRVEEENDSYYQLTADGKRKIPVAFDSQNNLLTYFGTNYIPLRESHKGKLYGSWENTEKQIRFEVSHGGNEMVWDVIRENGEPVRYYPKKQDDRYAFTYEGELWSFNVENGVLFDSKGNQYYRNMGDDAQNQTEATAAQLKTYNGLAKKYNAQPDGERIIPLNDLRTLEGIYRQMSYDQKRTADPFPECEVPAVDIEISISKDGGLVANGNSVAIEFLHLYLKKYNSELTKAEREKSVRATILPAEGVSKQRISRVEKILVAYGVAQLNIVGPEFNATLQDGASRELMKEYNALAKKYNSLLSKSNSIRIKMKDVERLEYIHGLMSEKQRADAEPFPDFPEPPEPPVAPRVRQGEKSAIPMPPRAPKTQKGEKGVQPAPPVAPRAVKNAVSPVPPPPPIPEDATPEERARYQKTIDAYNAKYRSEGRTLAVPPVPPEPQSPLDHVIEMAKKGATFYYEGEKIASDRAIELLKKNEDLNIQSSGTRSRKPTVKISKEPIYLDRSARPTSIETGNIDINGDRGFYSKNNGITSYFNSNGDQVNRNGKVLRRKSDTNPKFYFNDRQISSEKASRLLSSNTSLHVNAKSYADGSYALMLVDLNAQNAQAQNRIPNPNSVIDLTEMIAKEALFFYNDEPITTERALWLTQHNQIERVNTIQPKNGKPKVYFWEKA